MEQTQPLLSSEAKELENVEKDLIKDSLGYGLASSLSRNSLTASHNCQHDHCKTDNVEYCTMEPFLYTDVLTGLEEELKESEMKITYSIKLLLEQTAMTMVRVQRARRLEANSIIKIINIDNIHPLAEYIEKLEKQLIFLLKQLGLLPEQVIERERIMIVKRLKKKLFEYEKGDNAYQVEAICETENRV